MWSIYCTSQATTGLIFCLKVSYILSHASLSVHLIYIYIYIYIYINKMCTLNNLFIINYSSVSNNNIIYIYIYKYLKINITILN